MRRTLRRPRSRARRLILGTWSGWVGAAVLLMLLVIIVAGPWLAPYGPNEIVAPPLMGPSGEHLLGTDILGRDVLSRVLEGGWTVVLLAGISTLLAYVVALPAGLAAASSRGRVDAALMRSLDVILAFPALLLLLVLVATTGAGAATVVVAVAITQIPGLARIVRAASVEVAVKSFVDAARVRGESTRSVMFREILPNISGTLAADLGVRLTLSILLIAAANFLGLGLQPPTPDWGLMVAENRPGLELQPWPVVVPALLIATLTVAVNLVADSVTRSLGTSIEEVVVAEEAGPISSSISRTP